MSATQPGFDRIWAWREEMGDVYTGEWAPEGDPNAPIEAIEYIRSDVSAARIADLDRQLAEREAQVARLLEMQTEREVDHERQLAEAQALIYAARQERDAAEDAEKELAEELRTVKRQLAEARTDAEMAVALAYQRAGEAAWAYCHARTVEGRQLKSPAVFTTHSGQDMRAAILALAPADALAEVDRMRAERDAAREALMNAGIALHVAKRETTDAEAEVARLRKERDRLGRALNVARYGQPDFAWSIHKDSMADLSARAEAAEAEVARLREALTAARQVVYQSSIDRTQPEEAESALRLIDAALTTPEKDATP